MRRPLNKKYPVISSENLHSASGAGWSREISLFKLPPHTRRSLHLLASARLVWQEPGGIVCSRSATTADGKFTSSNAMTFSSIFW